MSLTLRLTDKQSFVGNVLFNKVVDKSFTTMFAINTCLMIVATLHCLFFLKWQTSPTQKTLREAGVTNPIRDFFDVKNIKQTITTLTKKRRNNRRLFLWFLLISMAFYTFQRGKKAKHISRGYLNFSARW